MSTKRRKTENGHSNNGHSSRDPASTSSTASDSGSSAGSKNGHPTDHGVVSYMNIRERYPVYDTARAAPHKECSETCRFDESQIGVETYARVVHSPLVIPLLFGYDRQNKITPKAENKSTIVYVTPCGRTVTDMPALDRYLQTVKSFIPITCFSFEPEVSIARRFVIPRSKVKAAKIITNASCRNEIPAFNCYEDKPPPTFIYVNKTINSTSASTRIDTEGMRKRSEWCSCKGVCSGHGDEGDCLCLSIMDEQISGYKYGLLMEPQKYVVECSDSCSCSPFCRNRVSTNTIPWRVILYYYPKKGWGVRSTCDIPQGAFVGLYVGHLLTEVEIGRGDRPDTYFFTLKDLDEEAPVPQSAATNKNGDLSAMDVTTTNPFEKLFSLDANRFGNYTRFFNHSCDPNCFAQPVFRDYCGPLVYSIGFFAKKNITAGEEMTWDYNYSIGSDPERCIHCHCGSATCRGRLL